MRVVFNVIGNSRRSNYLNGYNLRYGGGGGSGTDSSAIVVAEHLAKHGVDVVFITDRLEEQLEQQHKENGEYFLAGTKVNGVTYTNSDLEGVDDNEFDILINMLWYNDYDNLKIKVKKALVYWSHMQWIYGVDDMIKYVTKHNLKLHIVNISNWEKQMNNSTAETLKNSVSYYRELIIPNPIMEDIVEETIIKNIKRKKNKFIFHAAWARGGDVSLSAVRDLNIEGSEFHAFDYLMATHDHQDEFFFRHDAVDKTTLFKHLAESEYFIYPLYTPYQDVHKDTFSCVVAEAIAMGVIVITYPLGALPENFSDFCIWMTPPEGAKTIEDMQKEPLTKDLEGVFKNTKNIMETVRVLESNPKLKETIRKKGKDYILRNFNSNKVGSMWLDMLNESIN